jgi:hypothetical protein
LVVFWGKKRAEEADELFMRYIRQRVVVYYCASIRFVYSEIVVSNVIQK